MSAKLFKILLVEDDSSIRQWLERSLIEAGYRVEACASLRSARECLGGSHDLMLLDLGLPDGDELELPVIILTARGTIEERVRGLDGGADDYVVKPIEIPELLARIRSVLRRTRRGGDTGRLAHGDLWADSETREAGVRSKSVGLRRRELDLLLFLLRSPGRTWTRHQLLEAVWGPTYAGDTRSVDMCAQRLRAGIEEDARDPRFIETVWGVGYRLREDGLS